MNTKKSIAVGVITLVLFVNTILTGCGREYMNSSEPSINFFELIEDGNFDGISLTIYYKNFLVLTRAPVKLEQLIGGWHDNTGRLISGWYDYRVIVTGENLNEYRELLNQLANIELVSEENASVVDARLYYVFEHDKYGEIFSFLAFGRENDTVFVNGAEVKYNRVFFDIVLPFLPQSAVDIIEIYLSNK